MPAFTNLREVFQAIGEDIGQQNLQRLNSRTLLDGGAMAPNAPWTVRWKKHRRVGEGLTGAMKEGLAATSNFKLIDLGRGFRVSFRLDVRAVTGARNQQLLRWFTRGTGSSTLGGPQPPRPFTGLSAAQSRKYRRWLGFGLTSNTLKLLRRTGWTVQARGGR